METKQPAPTNVTWLGARRDGVTTAFALVDGVEPTAVAARLASLEITIDPAPAPKGDPEGRAFVVGVGDVGAAAALAYASGGRRPTRAFADFEALWAWLAATERSSIFIFAPCSLFTVARCSEIIDRLYEAELAGGVFPLPADKVDAVAAAVRLVALSSGAAPRPRGVATFSDAGAFDELMYGPDDVDELLARLQAGVSTFVFQGHGNGADMKLGRVALCTQADDLRPPPAAPGSRALPCQSGGPCARRRMSGFVGAGSLHCDTLVLVTCWGWLPSDSVLDPAFGFVAALFGGAHTRAVVAPIGVVRSGADHASGVRDFLVEGATFGELSHALNDMFHPGARQFLCFGDPDLKADGAPLSPGRPRPAEPIAHARRASVGRAGDRGPREHIVRDAVDAGVLSTGEARDFLESTDAAGMHDRAAAFASLAATLAVRRSGMLMMSYSGQDGEIDFGQDVATPFRHHCGAPLVRSDGRFGSETKALRSIWTCARCGMVCDAPAGLAPAQLEVIGPTRLRMRLPGGYPDRMHFAAAVEATGTVVGASTDVRGAAGDTDVEVPLPTTEIHEGSQVAFGVITWGDTFAIARTPFVRTPGG